MSRKRHRLRLLRPILRPFPGRKLPPDLRLGRVELLAAALPQGIADPGFEVLLRRIDGAPIYGGNQVEVFFNGRDAFSAMRESGRSAEQEVLLESYIFKDDSTGQAFLAVIKETASRGVAVRVLADAIGSFSTRAEFWQEMESCGVEVKLFNPLIKALWYQPYRDHRKILVVDRKVAFTGGMNIGEEYGSLRRRPKPGETWRDTHVKVIGPAAWEMAVVFSEGWTYSGGGEIAIDPLPSTELEAPGSRILVLDSRPHRGQAESAAVLAAIAAAAKKTLWITNAYFAPASRASTSSPPARPGGSTSASSSPASRTCPSPAGRATATSISCWKGGYGSSSTRPPSSTPRPWWRTASSRSWARRTSISAPSSSTTSAIC